MPAKISRRRRSRVGVLCYDLSPASLSLLTILSKLKECFAIKAYPLFGPMPDHPFEFEFRASSRTPRTIFFNNSRGTSPENQITTLGIRVVWEIVYGSDAIVLLGIQGFPALLTAALARLKRKPLIVVSQTMGPLPEMNRPLFLRRLKALVLKAASQHIAQTPKTVETLKAVYQVKDENITVIAYDGGAKQFHRVISNMDRGARLQVRAALAFPSGARIILYCGTLINLKGVDVLIKAMAQLRSADPKCFLLIAGRDGDRYGSLTSLRCLADSLGLASGVRFLGDLPWEELARIYVAADVFVLPTRKDTWGKVLVEAGLAGLPLVTTQVCGGAGSLVQDGVNGYVVPVDDVGALGEALLKLTDPLRRRAFGNASRAIMADYLREINEEVLFRVVLERCLGAGT